MRLVGMIGFAAACAVATLASAGPAEDAVKARRGFFTMLGMEMGPLAAMAKGEIAYDAAAASGHAANLKALTSYSFGKLFIEGSSKADLPGDTRAQAAIWADGVDFAAKATGFVDAVAAFQSVAGAGRAELGGGLGAIGATCKACHDSYRAKDF